MKRRAWLVCSSLAVLSASAQPVGMEQVTPPQPRQIGIHQVPQSAVERPGADAQSRLELKGDAAQAASPSLLAIAPRRPPRTTVDADEIARILGSGQVNSIDSAAAVALESLDANTPPTTDEPKADDPAAALARALSGAPDGSGEKP